MSPRSRSSAATPPADIGGVLTAEQVCNQFREVRAWSDEIAAPLMPEDQVVQSMTDMSPTKWHRAHTTWFFETFVLTPHARGYAPFHRDFQYLFNSYYNTLGEQYPRPQRGLISRPTVAQVDDYRAHVDVHLVGYLRDENVSADVLKLVEIGLHHEQQHQELMLTDIKHLFSCNPLFPAYRDDDAQPLSRKSAPLRWASYAEGLRQIGHAGETFSYDNESPRHRVFLEGYELASRLVTCGEYLAFIEDGGYSRPELWLSEGWDTVRAQRWIAPLYWHKQDDGWRVFTLGGLRALAPSEPVCHVSYFEADAYARWSGARLPTEAEWEVAAASQALAGNFVETRRLHPTVAAAHSAAEIPVQMFGDAWEWTASPYIGYPGYRPPAGALGEYNGKFMCNQFVLRGGSCVSPQSHLRATYRNFFPPAARWQFSGIRLARQA